MTFHPFFRDYYLVQKSFINPTEARTLGLQYKKYLEDNDIGNDEQVDLCRATSDFLPFWQLLVDKNYQIGNILGQKVLPSYTYSRMYLNGSELVPHTDIECCEIDVSIHMNGDKPWPIWLDSPTGTKSIILEPGDALFYLGNKMTHWREKYDGEWYVNAFLFYVFSNGPNRHLLFDVTKLASYDRPRQETNDTN